MFERAAWAQPGSIPANEYHPGSIYTLVTGDYGGDRTGGVLLSPLLKPGTVSNTPFNHYSLLKALEDIYHTNGYLGYAGQARPAVVVRMRFVGHKTERFRSGRCLETAVTRDWQAEAPAAPHGTWEITLESTRNLR